MKVLARALLLFLPLTLLVAACGSDGGNSSSSNGGGESRPTPGAEPTAATASSIDLTKDDLGRSVSGLPQVPQRIVAMSPSVVELVYAVGATPVGRPNSATYPDAATSVPNFGTSYAPNIEEVAAMKPDLIIADAVIDAGPNIEALARLGAPVYAVKIASFEDVTRSLRVVGALTGRRSNGESAAANLETKLTQIKAKVPSNKPNFLVLVNAGPGQFIAAKDGSYLPEVLKQIGAKNLVTTEQDNFRFPGFTDYSPERIIEKNPDIIFTLTLGGPPGATTKKALEENSALSTLKAVKEGKVYEVDPNIYLQSAGPRVSVMLDELPKLLYPSVFTP